MGTPDGVYPEFPPHDEVPFEILVSHVCRHWRSVALSTHTLWTTIHFRLLPHMNRAPYYLERSHRQLINILVDTCAVEEHVPGVTLFREEFMPIFHLVIPHIARWKSLSLKVRDRECKLGARTALNTCGTAPNLEYLQLWHIENWASTEVLIRQIGPPPVDIFNRSLPALKHVVLIGVNVPWLSSSFLENLITIEFGLHSDEVRIPYNIWSRMLSTSPNLYRMSLHYSGPKASTGEWPATVISLPGLRELELTDMEPQYTLQVLQRLSMPNVTRLQVELNDHEKDFSEFLDYLAEPPAPAPPPGSKEEQKEGEEEEPKPPQPPVFPVLETLVIKALDCTPKSFVNFLQHAASISRLELACNKMSASLLEQLWLVHKRAPVDAKAKGKAKAETDDAEPSAADDAPSTQGPSSSRPAARGTTRASSAESDGSDVNADDDDTSSTSTAPTSPSSVHAPLEPVPSQPKDDGVLLPQLDTVRISGGKSTDLAALIRFRQRVGRPVRRWYVNEGMRSDELECLQGDMVRSGGNELMVWFSLEDEEDEEGEESGSEEEYEDEEGVDAEEEEEGQVGGVLPAAAITGHHEDAGVNEEDDDEPYDYDDEDDDE